MALGSQIFRFEKIHAQKQKSPLNQVLWLVGFGT
jgi:hypothetical protein